MGAQAKTFEIGEHRYTYTTHPPSEGLRISLRLTGTGIATLGRSLSSLDGDGDVLAQALGEGASVLAAALERDDAPALVRQILAHTHRDGEALSQPHVFEAAYAGNYGELYEAVVEVATGNGFLPGLNTWRGIGKRAGLDLAEIAGQMPKS